MYKKVTAVRQQQIAADKALPLCVFLAYNTLICIAEKRQSPIRGENFMLFIGKSVKDKGSGIGEVIRTFIQYLG